MLKDLTKLILTSKAALDILKEKIESKACDLAIQVRAGLKPAPTETQNPNETCEQPQAKLKEKAKLELSELISEITHRAQINELQVKGFIKDKLTELTNNALLDSMELNDIRAEIAALRAEISDLKAQMNLQRR